MTVGPSAWVEVLVGLLLLASAIVSLIAAVGMLRFDDFFQRMHMPAIVVALATWCVALATIVYFSALGSRLAPYSWVIVVLLVITTPVTTMLMARAALSRERRARSVTDSRSAAPAGPVVE